MKLFFKSDLSFLLKGAGPFKLVTKSLALGFFLSHIFSFLDISSLPVGLSFTLFNYLIYASFTEIFNTRGAITLKNVRKIRLGLCCHTFRVS